MKTIYKYGLSITDQQFIRVPEGAELLTAQFQGQQLQLWAKVDTSKPLERREIAIYGTGNPVPENSGAYIATVQHHGGALVWHVFDLGSKGGAA